MKKILFVNGSFNEIPLIEVAHKKGLYVITSGNDPTGEGHQYSDSYIAGDYSNADVILKIAKDNQVDYICSCGNDFGAITASYVADRLGLPGHDSLEVSKYFHEKDQFKRLCARLHLNTPQSVPFVDKDKAISYLKEASFPLIIKPSDLGGGKGIEVVNTFVEGVNAIEAAFKASKIKTVLIEDYIVGTQHGFTCFIKNKKVAFTYYTDDYSYLNPYMVWVAIPHDENKDLDIINKIKQDVELMAETLSMSDGMLTIQVIVKDGVPYYIETMRRCLGNMHYKCLSWDLGFDVYNLFVTAEMGEDTSSILNTHHSLQHYSAFMGVYADKNGVYQSLTINEKYQKNVKEIKMLEEKGYVISDYLREKIGMVFFSFDSEEEKNAFVKDLRKILKVVVA